VFQELEKQLMASDGLQDTFMKMVADYREEVVGFLRNSMFPNKKL
jgi:hypothetical protein